MHKPGLYYNLKGNWRARWLSGLIVLLGLPSVSGADFLPNIIVILADDLGYADVSYHGSTQIATPNIDALARNGTVFLEGYVSAPVCAPSRAGLLTGRIQTEFGFDNNIAENQPGFDPQFRGLPVSVATLPDLLKKAGYTTGLIGKWHLGEEPQFHPLRRGFDEFWGLLGGGRTYFEHEVSRNQQIQSNFTGDIEVSYLTDDIARHASNFISRHRDSPFFLFVSFTAPHAPMEAPDDLLRVYRNVVDPNRRAYLAMVHSLDDNIGRILQVVQNEELTKETIVVFLSDNGGPVDQNNSLNAPLRGQKGILLEGGIRVPFLMSWPGTIPTGNFTSPVWSLDLAPTFLSIAGLPVPDSMDGIDLIPYLVGPQRDAIPNRPFFWRFTISASMRMGDWKLVRVPDRLPMLYNLSADISELEDRTLEQLETVRSMLKQLGDWDVSLQHPLFLEGAEWKRKQLDLYDVIYDLEQP